jgi:mono/diheme cytochrome c family protein
MRGYRLVRLGTVLLLAWPLGLQARKPKQEGGPAGELRKAPLAAQSLKNPFAGQSDAVAAGRKLYKQHCAQCHGQEAQGQDRAPDLRSPAIQKAPPGSLLWILRNGKIRKGMPSWSRLPDEQLWQLVAYLQSLQMNLEKLPSRDVIGKSGADYP